MHAYDVHPRRPSFTPVPSARASQDSLGSPSATPIYDAIVAEWLKTFRALPGDRSGEEEMKFVAFGFTPHGAGAHETGSYGTGSYGTGSYSAGSYGTGSYGTGSYGSNAYTAYSAGAYSARHGTGQQQTQWQRVGSLGRHDTGMHHVPAALPPGPRRGA
ncbi:hypothetical protein [Streptomyces sp. NPDC006012]|uniref:hypothetical protein n=1 Tax=Streptomyces sp. NPDC006012 TaxID=3364739 RepID=UPI0036798221